MYSPQIKEKLALVDLARYGTQARKSIHPNILVGYSHPQYRVFREGDILDANGVLNLINDAYNEDKVFESLSKEGIIFSTRLNAVEDVVNQIQSSYVDPSENTAELTDMITNHTSDANIHVTQEEKDFWNSAKDNIQSDWDEQDATSSSYIQNKPQLKQLALKDSASMVYTPSGINRPSNVTLQGGSTSKLNTIVIKTVDGTDTVHDTPQLKKDVIMSVDEWNGGVAFSVTYDEQDELLTLNDGIPPQIIIKPMSVGTDIIPGDTKTFAKASIQNTIVATGNTSSSGEGAEIVTSLPTSGIAEGQVFQGVQSTITVS